MLKHLRYALAAMLFIALLATASSCDRWLEPTEPTQPTANHEIPIEFREVPR